MLCEIVLPNREIAYVGRSYLGYKDKRDKVVCKSGYAE